MTNREKVNQMSNEELSCFLLNYCRLCIYCDKKGEMGLCYVEADCRESIKKYLDSEVQ